MTRSRRIGVALVVITLVAVALGLWHVRAWHRDAQTLDRRQAALNAATTEVTRLISISAKDSAADIATLQAGATSAFAKELAAEATRLAAQLKDQKVAATGSVVSAGVGQSTDDHATAYIAASGSVINAASPLPQVRTYRFKVDMQLQGGRWLVAGLEFVA